MLKHIDHTYDARKVLPDHVRPLQMEGKRTFSHLMRDTNRAFLPASRDSAKAIRVGFILPEHFSMMSFTAAVDALVTANLVQTAPLFNFSTYGINSDKVSCDLGIEISTEGGLDSLYGHVHSEFDVIIVCGGFRCSMAEDRALTELLKAAAKNKTVVGGIWNGAISLAYAGLLDNMQCALHPDNHAFMRERFTEVRVTDNTLELEPKIITSAGPASALEMMLQLIDQLQGREIMRAVREILSCDQVAEQGSNKLTGITDNPAMPDNLRDIIQLMNANIEDPLSIDELVACIGISRRQIERLFQTHLDTSPSRYYLELRITHARRLLLQSNDSVTNIALACGFVTSSHFSNCFKDFFGVSPSHVRDKYRQNFS
ncbi:GlxA family transcriptional regulator [Amphritea sp. HPY]|uniref:GlxA family transcriptional regulator n=1 Tax=Amphritea sp. HPY TaxID=3421652 RepID=UPI003D7EC7C7